MDAARTSEAGSEAGKVKAGKRAAAEVRPGMKLGLGTGSTVQHFLLALGERCRHGELPEIVCVATSERTEAEARRLGIPLAPLEEVRKLDLTVDGADEVDPELNLIKGMGGALLREKMVAQASRELLIIVDGTKLVQRLGTRSPLPIEVVPFAWPLHVPYLAALGGRAELRKGREGDPFRTDNGNFILHCSFPGGIEDPSALEARLAGRAGVVESGLFLGMANRVIVGEEGGVRELGVQRAS